MEAGMGQFVGDDQVVGADQGGNDADIGEIARPEDQGRVGALDSRQACLHRLVERIVAGHQPRRPGPGAETLGGVHGRALERRVLR